MASVIPYSRDKSRSYHCTLYCRNKSGIQRVYPTCIGLVHALLEMFYFNWMPACTRKGHAVVVRE